MIEAIILAGGEGRRLRTVVQDLPKPMADIAGRPFLWWLLTRLNQQGVGRVVLSVGYKAEVIQDYFGLAFNGTEIAYSIETEPLGTGGAIRLALEQASQPGVIVINGDTYTNMDLGDLAALGKASGTDLAMAVAHLDNTSRYGAVLIDETTSRVIGFEEKKGASPGYINAGTYCLRRDLFQKYPVPLKFSFERDFLSNELTRLNPLAFKEVRGFIDIGIPEDYALAQTLIPELAGAGTRK
jgi:D-glycero-alpha-D-manno-heptose 1-phosphate guanylyltransferase